MRLLLVLLAVAVSAAAAMAQDRATTEHSDSVITIILPDGSTESIQVVTGQEVRIGVRDAEVIVIRDSVRDDAQALAYRVRPGERIEEDIEVRLEDVLERLPGEIRDRIQELSLPRLRVERDVSPESHRELARVERETRRLAVDLRRAELDGDAVAADRLRAELLRSLEEAFDTHQDVRRERVESIEERRERLVREMAELEAEIAERERNRAAIIERRARELTGDRSELDW